MSDDRPLCGKEFMVRLTYSHAEPPMAWTVPMATCDLPEHPLTSPHNGPVVGAGKPARLTWSDTG